MSPSGVWGNVNNWELPVRSSIGLRVGDLRLWRDGELVRRAPGVAYRHPTELVQQRAAASVKIINEVMDRGEEPSIWTRQLLRHVATAWCLVTLELSATQLCEASLCAIAREVIQSSSTSLLRLCLTSSTFSPAVCAAFGDGLRSNTRLLDLDLSLNEISDAGFLRLLPGLSENRGLQLVNLSANLLGDASFTALSETLSADTHITSLSLRDMRISDEVAQGLLATLASYGVTSLQDVDLKFNDENMAFLYRNRHLTANTHRAALLLLRICRSLQGRSANSPFLKLPYELRCSIALLVDPSPARYLAPRQVARIFRFAATHRPALRGSARHSYSFLEAVDCLRFRLPSRFTKVEQVPWLRDEPGVATTALAVAAALQAKEKAVSSAMA